MPQAVADKRALSPREIRKIVRERFLHPRKAETLYQRKLSAVGRQVGFIVKQFAPEGKVHDMPTLISTLLRYADELKPWAKEVTQAMHFDVYRRDAKSWFDLSREMGRTLRKEIMAAPVGKTLRGLMNEQVDLITSLPRDAAKRVHSLALETLTATAGRADELTKEILRSGQVSVGRAKLIARTETSRTAALLQEARAKYVGSESYTWRTSRDADVRPAHRKLEGKTFRWDDPPIADESGIRANPGTIWNCRCWAEPLLPD